MSLNKLAPLTGILGIAGVIVGLATDNFPDGTVGDAGVAKWFTVHGHSQWLVSAMAIALGGAVLLVFAAVLTARVEAAGASPVARNLVQTSATAWALLTMMGGALWATVPTAMSFMNPAPPSAEIYHFFSGAAYGVLVSVCAFAAAVLAATLTAVSLRTGLLPRWLTIAGVPASVLMLANMMLPMAVITLWFSAVAISLARRSVPAAVTADAPVVATVV
jgi:hypothetical protein